MSRNPFGIRPHILRTACFALGALLLLAPPARAGFALYVSNYGNNSILKFDAAGNMTVFATNGVNGVLSAPQGLAGDCLGNIYVANNGNDTIEKYDPSGHGTTLATGPFPLYPTCLAMDKLNYLLVATTDSTVYRITNSLGQGGSFYPRNLSQLYAPYGMAFDNAGNLYVANNGSGTVEKFAYPGTSASVFIPSVSQPVGIAFDSAGNVYVSSYGGPSKITKYNAQGTGGVTFGTGYTGPYGMAFDSAGFLYVADYGASAIYKVSASGTKTTFADSTKGLRNPEFIVIQEPGRYSEDWFKAAGGGGTSTGTGVSVSGTIGQHDAGAMASGSNSLTGGFWSLYAVPTPGAPLLLTVALTITLTSTNAAMVYWPSPSTGWNLQQNTNLATANWVTPAETVNDNGTIKYIIVNPPTGNRFYRLMK